MQKCRNMNSPRQFNTQQCNAMKKKSHGVRKIIPLSVEVREEWKREGESSDCREKSSKEMNSAGMQRKWMEQWF